MSDLTQEEAEMFEAERAEWFTAVAEGQYASLERDLGRTLTGAERDRMSEALARQFEDQREPDAARAFYGSLEDPNRGVKLWAKYQATGYAIDPVNHDSDAERWRFMEQRLADANRAHDEAEQPEPELSPDATEAERHEWMIAKATGGQPPQSLSLPSPLNRADAAAGE